MILHGNQRGGAKDLALHLLKTENEHVEIHELRGFVASHLVPALNEIYAVSRGTKARQFLFSLSLNPPPSAKVPTTAFEDAIERIERKLGLTDQPRAIVFHEKAGRRHCHAVWSRIDTVAMKAIPLSHSKRKLMDIARELYREHGWTMPRGLMPEGGFDPKNFTLAQWQQAKRIGKDPKTIKQVFQDCWAASDNQAAFREALKEYGYTLARGDRRGFVALDYACEVYAVAKWVGIKTKEVKAKLTDKDALPSVDEAKARIARDMATHLQDLQARQDSAINDRIAEIEQARERMIEKHRSEREALQERQTQRRNEETKQRQARYHKGLRGLLDRLTGYHRRIQQQNEEETRQARVRDQEERDALVFVQQDQRRSLQQRKDRLHRFQDQRQQALSHDVAQYDAIRVQRQDTFVPRSLDRTQRKGGRFGYER